MKVIVGLGNPGAQYAATRHNIGFTILDRCCTTGSGAFTPARHLKAHTCKLALGSQAVFLAKPDTYMNDSGLSVAAILSWFKVPNSNLLVIHDDVSLPLGRLRFQKEGGAGGQHGIESIIEHLSGAKNFNRLKIGVGPDPGGDLRAQYVLSKFPEEQKDLVNQIIDWSYKAALVWLEQGIQEAMNNFNGSDLRVIDDKEEP